MLLQNCVVKHAVPLLKVLSTKTHPFSTDPNRLLPLLVRSHEFHLQRKDTILRLSLVLPNQRSVNRRSTNRATFLRVASVQSLVETFGAEEMACLQLSVVTPITSRTKE